MSDCIFCGGTGKQNEHRRDNGDPLGRAINESNRYQAMVFEAWRAMRGQAKGLRRQRRLITRLQAENAKLKALHGKPGMIVDLPPAFPPNETVPWWAVWR